MSMYGKNHYNIVISLQLIKINGKKKVKVNAFTVTGSSFAEKLLIQLKTQTGYQCHQVVLRGIQCDST